MAVKDPKLVEVTIDKVIWTPHRWELDKRKRSIVQKTVKKFDKLMGGPRREERQEQAKVRDQERQGRSAVRQIALLDMRLGTGRGAERERARLKVLVEKEFKAKKDAQKLKENK